MYERRAILYEWMTIAVSNLQICDANFLGESKAGRKRKKKKTRLKWAIQSCRTAKIDKVFKLEYATLNDIS